MSVVSKATIAKYLSRVATPGSIWTESELVSFRSLVNTKLSDQPDTREMLLDRFNAAVAIVPYQLEQQQQLKGLNWLRSTQLNKKGQLRDSATTFIGQLELSILIDAVSVELAGLQDVARNSCSGYRRYVPVYRVTATSGQWFEYSSACTGAFFVSNRGGSASSGTRAV